MMDMTVRRMKDYAKVVLGWSKGRRLTVFPDDVFLVSYPRSGSTWMRFLVANLISTDEPASFLNIERLTPDIQSHPDFVLRRTPRPRFMKSEECFEPRYKRVIYLVRDPRDVAVSYYHIMVKRRYIPDGYPMATYIEQWMKPRWTPEYGTWAEHVKSWLGMRRGEDGFLLVSYEDLQARPDEELAKIATFLGLERSSDEISRAVELSSADRMRALEKVQKKQWIATKYSRLDKPFVRTATSGGWKVVLPQESVEAIEAAWGPLMESLGYPLSVCAVEKR